jgi:hypothetical protein
MSNVNAVATKMQKTITKRTAELLQRYPIRNRRWTVGNGHSLLQRRAEFCAEISELEGDAKEAAVRTLSDPWGRPFEISMRGAYMKPVPGFSVLQEPERGEEGCWVIGTTVAGVHVTPTIFND